MRKVTREELIKMIENNEDYSQVDVSEITDFSRLFEKKVVSFDISNWDMSSAVNMTNMFMGADCPFSLNNWNVSNVELMCGLFASSSYNLPLNNWNVSKVRRMVKVFYKSEYNHPLNSWDVSSVENMNSMFYKSKYNHPLGDWDVSSVENMNSMFCLSIYNHPLNDWNVFGVIFLERMFSRSKYRQSLKKWKINKECDVYTIFQGADIKDYPKNIDIKALFQSSSFFLQPEDEGKMNVKIKNSYMLENQLLELNFSETEGFTGKNINYEKPINFVEIEHKEGAYNAKQFYFLKQGDYFLKVHESLKEVILEDCLAA